MSFTISDIVDRYWIRTEHTIDGDRFWIIRHIDKWAIHTTPIQFKKTAEFIIDNEYAKSEVQWNIDLVIAIIDPYYSFATPIEHYDNALILTDGIYADYVFQESDSYNTEILSYCDIIETINKKLNSFYFMNNR